MAEFQLVILPEAAQEVREAHDWYEERNPGLGDRFLQAVEACLERIRQNPQMHGIVCETYRRAIVRHFPYAIFYEHAGDAVTVYSVFHCSQDPEKWQRRLPAREENAGEQDPEGEPGPKG